MEREGTSWREEKSSDIRRELLCRRRIKNRRMKKGGGERLVFIFERVISMVAPISRFFILRYFHRYSLLFGAISS